MVGVVTTSNFLLKSISLESVEAVDQLFQVIGLDECLPLLYIVLGRNGHYLDAIGFILVVERFQDRGSLLANVRRKGRRKTIPCN